MRRSERQYAIVDALRARAERPVSVTALAARFGVSSRTIERDIRALRDAGVPIYGEPGRTGGHAIGRDFSLPPLALTTAEALAALSGLAVMAGSPFADDSRSAADKILAAMPFTARDEARAFASRVSPLAPDAPTEPGIAAAVRGVLADPHVVRLEYADPRTGDTTERAVEPLGLILVRGNWILVGWCRLRRGIRGFRTDGIRRIEVTAERVVPREGDPLGADLERWDFLPAAGA